jgi:glycosyltransferase involved in cell wall biosynthesis
MIRVAFVRGADLNPWHTHSMRMLGDDFEVTAFGSSLHHFQVSGLGMPLRMRFGLGGLRVPGFLRFLRRWWARDTIFRLEQSLRGFRLVHTTDIAAGYSYQCLRYCQQSGAKLVCTVFENIPFVHEEVPRLARQKEALRRGVDLFLPVTRRAAQNLELEGVDPGRIKVLDPGIDIEHFSPRAATLEVGLNLPQNAYKVLYVGRLVPEKGLLTLLYAFAWLVRSCERERPLHLVMVGQGALQGRLMDEVRRFGLERRVHFLGPMRYEKLPGLYRWAHCLVLASELHPTWHEQYGMVLAEAMASGLPVVGSDCGAIPEVIGPAGLLFGPGDPFALAAQIERLYGSETLCHDLGLRGRAEAEKRMDSRQSARELARLYKSLIG